MGGWIGGKAVLRTADCRQKNFLEVMFYVALNIGVQPSCIWPLIKIITLDQLPEKNKRGSMITSRQAMQAMQKG